MFPKAQIEPHKIVVRGVKVGTNIHEGIKMLHGQWNGIGKCWEIPNTWLNRRVLYELGVDGIELEGVPQ